MLKWTEMDDGFYWAKSKEAQHPGDIEVVHIEMCDGRPFVLVAGEDKIYTGKDFEFIARIETPKNINKSSTDSCIYDDTAL